MKKVKIKQKDLTLVTDLKQIKKEYYHKGNDQYFYTFTLDQYSIKDINHFIKHKLIYVKDKTTKQRK